MAKVTPQEYAEKWARRTSAATEDYKKGVSRVTIAPGIQAAEKQEKLVQNFNQSVTDGTWARRVAGVSLQEWKEKAGNKGAGRIASGVQGAQAGQVRFATELLSAVDSAKATVDVMPDLTLEDRIQKSIAWQRIMSEFRRS